MRAKSFAVEIILFTTTLNNVSWFGTFAWTYGEKHKTRRHFDREDEKHAAFWSSAGAFILSRPSFPLLPTGILHWSSRCIGSGQPSVLGGLHCQRGLGEFDERPSVCP